MPRRPKFLTPADTTVERALNTLLEGHYPPPAGLRANPSRVYERRHDDTDGERGQDQYLTVMFSVDGDAWLTQGFGQSLRFRKGEGGGQSVRVQRALMVLAEAIRRDNEEWPQSPPEFKGS